VWAGDFEMGSEDPPPQETLTREEGMHLAQSSSAAESVGLLVARCVAGEEDAWRGLHRRYHRTAVTVLRRLGVRPHQLEDCCQDVFLDVFRYLPKFRGDADFRTWLYRVCISHARVARRRARLRSWLTRIWSEELGEDAGHPLEEGQASRRIAEALEKLPDSERVVFVLFELEGIAGKDVAEMVSCPEATVFRRLHHARKRFIAAVQAGGGFQP
jgi:RNA polymerase sigma-70 factor, ECF subfamily